MHSVCILCIHEPGISEAGNPGQREFDTRPWLGENLYFNILTPLNLYFMTSLCHYE